MHALNFASKLFNFFLELFSRVGSNFVCRPIYAPLGRVRLVRRSKEVGQQTSACGKTVSIRVQTRIALVIRRTSCLSSFRLSFKASFSFIVAANNSMASISKEGLVDIAL